MEENPQNNIIIYTTQDGKASVALFAKDGNVWMNQSQMAELFDTSKQNISLHIQNILKDRELSLISVVKDYLTTATDGKDYNITFYALDMILTMEKKALEQYTVFDTNRKHFEAIETDRQELEELKALAYKLKPKK